MRLLKTRPRLFLFFLIAALLCSVLRVQAQSPALVRITALNTSSFPTLQVEFEAFDEQGRFLEGLKPADVTVLENDATLAVSGLELLQPGVQYTVALNLGPEMGNRYAGVSRYEAIQTALTDWAGRQPAGTTDRVSLATNDGLQLIRSDDPQEWTRVISALQPDLNSARPDLSAFTRAVDLVMDSDPESGMKHSILLVTPLISPTLMDALPNLADRAAQMGVRVDVWLVASTSTPTSSPLIYESFLQLAGKTGGSLFLFSGAEELPDPDNGLNSLRYTYRAQYLSKISETNTHVVALRVNSGGLDLQSDNKPVYVNVAAPNPIFLSPPAQVERTWNAPVGGDLTLGPDTVDLKLVIEFPDGHPRPLKVSRLYVDGTLVVENTAEPFDVFTWDISGYGAAGRHLLRAEVEDTLGLSRSSIEVPVDIAVEPEPRNWLQANLTGDRLMVVGAIVGTGAVLALVLILAGRSMRRKNRAERKADKDPLTQPVPIKRDTGRRSRPAPIIDRPTWPRHVPAILSSAPAWLVRIPDVPVDITAPAVTPKSAPAQALPLSKYEVTLGTDSKLASAVVNAPSVSPLHARIKITGDNTYVIRDAGSVAGTWVNYAPVPVSGVVLRHGDLIQIGKVAFRFELAHPPEEAAPRVMSSQEPE